MIQKCVCGVLWHKWKYFIMLCVLAVLLFLGHRYSYSMVSFYTKYFSGKQFHIYYTTNTSYQIFPDDAKPSFITTSPYLIRNPEVCMGDSVIKYVIVVHSAIDHLEMRNNLRTTWANPKVFSQFAARTVFFLGKPSSIDAQKEIEKESTTYKDIVQGDFIDHYNNLTLKALTVLRWVTEECSNAEAIIKVDDDVFLDIFKVVWEILPLLELKPKQMICSGTAHAIIFRDNSIVQEKKWTLSESFFPGRLYFPMPYCYGQAVFMSPHIVKQLFLQGKSSPIFFIDDTFVFGVLADKVPGLSWRFLSSAFSLSVSETLASFRHKSYEETLLVGTAKQAKTMYELWEILNGHQKIMSYQI